MTEVWAGYVRQSVHDEDDGDISEDTQRAAILRRVPEGAEVEWFVDLDLSGGNDQRPEYQRMLQSMTAGKLAGIAAYDDSRLNRDTLNSLMLYRACAERGVALRVDDSKLTAAQLFDDDGSLEALHVMRSSMSSAERKRIAKRMRAGARLEFDRGGPRGQDWFGYRTARDWSERRQAFLPRRSDGVTRDLEVVEEEADAVRHLFALLARHTLVETADILNAEGVVSPSGRGWSSGAVRAVWSNRWEYLGFVTLGRRGAKNAKRLGLDTERRPGRHPAIVTEEEFRDAVAGVESRRTGVGKPKQHHKTYLLSGVMFCQCGARMWGEPRYKTRPDGSKKLYRYYLCPISGRRGLKPDADGQAIVCHERAVPAEDAEAAVLAALESFVLPAAAIDEARDLLRARLKAPQPGLSDQKRKRLQTRLVQLRKQHGWGDISDAEYLAEKEATERELVLLPDNDKLVLFDRQRQIVVSMAENLRRATLEQRREFVLLLVERAVAAERTVQMVSWVPPARPFFGAEAAAVLGGGFLVPPGALLSLS